MKNYDDILFLDRPVSKTHPPMDPSNRAAQFSPFAALTGHQDAIEDVANALEKQIELDGYIK